MTDLTENGVDRAASRITSIPFFPSSDKNARAILIEELVKICASDAHAEWLAVRAIQVFNQWPGYAELRAVYCKRFKPCDGVQADSAIYVDGFPTEHELGIIDIKGLPAPIAALPQAPPPRQLEGEVSADPEACEMVADLMKSTSLAPWVPPAERRARERREIQEAEKEIAEAVTRPTLGEEEKARRIAELELALGMK
jgi:hypothetical protein